MPSQKHQILLVEDEIEVAEIIRDYLQNENYHVELIHTGAGVVDKVRTMEPHMVLLDIMLPEVDGITICKKIRTFSEVPIIMLTAKVDEIDRLLGYELGADDYICKPVNPREILARVKAVLRRLKPIATDSKGSLELDKSRLLAIYQGHRLNLTATEFRLLKLLHDKEGKIFSRKQIRAKIYSDNNSANDRAIDTCIKKIRQKISAVSNDDNPIHSVYGLGYKFERNDFTSPNKN